MDYKEYAEELYCPECLGKYPPLAMTETIDVKSMSILNFKFSTPCQYCLGTTIAPIPPSELMLDE